MLNFTVGPVQSCDEVREIGAEQVPYFRTPEFSEVMLENERLMKKFSYAEDSAKVVFITGSGTASMEASVVNSFTKEDKVLVVNGGSFGARFVEICEIYEVPYEQIVLEKGKALTSDDLFPFEGKGFTGFLVNLHETSTGVLYDLKLIGDFCKRNHVFLIVDAISAFLAENINMKENGIQMLITGSQKALACPPGVSIIILSGDAVERVKNMHVPCMYLNLKLALKNMERGQTPFTPAVGILLQIHKRLKLIEQTGGVECEVKKIAALADDFRTRIKEFPLDIYSQSLSNAVTALATRGCSAYDIFTVLKDEYNIWVCPNGGSLAEKVFRVGHIGELTIEDNCKLIDALYDLRKKGILI